MITNEKYVEVAKGLLEKTKKHKVPWKQSDVSPREFTSHYGTRSGPELSPPAFALKLSNSTVLLSFSSPTTEPDRISLMFLNKDNIPVDSWNLEDGDENWPLAFELYQEAGKFVNKWDKILEEVEAFIGKP